MLPLVITWLGLLSPIWLTAAPPGVPTSVIAEDDALVLGTTRGLYRYEGGVWSLVMARGEVRDLARGAAAIWIASGRQLYAWSDGSHEPRVVPLAAGARVRGLAVDHDERVWVATDVGLFVRDLDASAFRRSLALPPGEVSHVRAHAREVWVAREGSLWTGDGAEFEPRIRGVSEGWWELNGLVSWRDGVLLSVPNGFWYVTPDVAERLDPNLGVIRGVVRKGSSVYLASDRGVYSLERDLLHPKLELTSRAHTFARRSGDVVVATSEGVALLRAVPLNALASSPTRSDRAEIVRLHRLALAYQGLSPIRLRQAESRARKSAYLPEVSARFGLARDRSRDADHDQTFSSGETRQLFDTSSANDSAIDLDFEFSWDLGELRRPDDLLAISRERRQLIELRDQVLERINRVYFERERVLLQLGAASLDPPHEVELKLRATELTASLDAWTGGAFSRDQGDEQ